MINVELINNKYLQFTIKHLQFYLFYLLFFADLSIAVIIL